MGTNKKGILRADAAGYYQVTLGALDFYNSAGAFYALEPAKCLFEESSSLMRRVRAGTLRGEYAHPKFTPGMSKRDFLTRVLDIDEKHVSHHIRDVHLDYDSVKDKSGKNVVTIQGSIRPSGPYGDALAKSLENPDENVCFSIRSLTDDMIDPRGTHVKNLREIVTWDYVNEPGISVANKYGFPALESLEAVGFDRHHLEAARDHARAVANGMESSHARNIESALRAMGWEDNKPKGGSGLLLPASLRW